MRTDMKVRHSMKATAAQKSSFKMSSMLSEELMTADPVKVQQLCTRFGAKPADMKKVQKTGKGLKMLGTSTPKKVGDTTPVTAPEGLQTETYHASGMSFLEMAQVNYDVQIGFDGNDVYLQGILRAIPEAWIKGVKNGNEIVFATGQYLGETELFDMYDGSSLGKFPVWFEYTEDFEGYQDMTLVVNPETGVIDLLVEGMVYFAIDEDFNAADAIGYLRLTPDSALSGISYDLVTPPASAEQWGVDISGYSYGLEKQVSNTGMMAINGDEVYVLGLCPDMNAWLKGTMDAEGRVEFKAGQYIGQYAGMFDMWFMASTIEKAETGALCDAVHATWNAAEKSLVFDEGELIVENADAVSMYYLDLLGNVEVWPMSEDRTVVIPPVGLKTRPHKTTVASLGGYDYAYGSYNVNIGFDGGDAYVQGLLYFAPAAWIKGTRNADGSITFAKNQYLGTVQGFDVYVVPCDDEENILDDFTFTYDVEKDTYYYIEQNTNISFSVMPESTDAVEIVFNVVMRGPDAPEDEVFDLNVIFEQPEGELVTYSRSGNAYVTFMGYLIETGQSGTLLRIVNAPDGETVYMENPISQCEIVGGTWIKGWKEGNKIHMPLKQCIFDSGEGYGLITGVFEFNDADGMIEFNLTDDEEVTFTINEDGTISLDLDSELNEYEIATRIYGVAYSDDLMWAGYADYNTVYTPFNADCATIPEGLAVETWAYMYMDGQYSSAYNVNVAFDNDKIYIAGFSPNDPESAIVGTIDGDKVTIESDQFLGRGSGYLAYATFFDYSFNWLSDEYYDEWYEEMTFNYLPSYTFHYDVERRQITSNPADSVALVLNAGKGSEGIMYIKVGYDPKFSYFEEKPAVPADPEVIALDNWFDDYGYDILALNVKLEDVDGNYINQEKVFYQVWVSIEGEAEPFVLYVDEYTGLAEYGLEEISEIPFNFECFDDYGYEDIAAGGANGVIYQTGFDDYGVQTIYYGGDERNTSNIVWLSGNVTAITNVAAMSGNAAIYDLSGRQLSHLQKGINIIRTQSGKIVKVCVK